MNTRRPAHLRVIALLFAAVSSSTVSAAGFQLNEHDATVVGTSMASATAGAETASTVFFNPAGMVRMPGTQMAFATALTHTQFDFSNQGSRSVLAPGLLHGSDGGNGGSVAAIPSLFLTRELSPQFTAGLGINVPFGSTTKYADDWIGRYQAIKSSIATVNINPSIAWRANDRLSVGGGLDVSYMTATFTNAINFGLIAGGAPLFGARDGHLKITGDDWALGWNIGALYDMGNSRVGVAYRSQVKHSLRGDASYDSVPTPLAGVFRNTSITSDVTLPATLSFGAALDLDPRWTLFSDWTWTQWDKIQELRVRYDNPTAAQTDSVTPLQWSNSWRLALGASYRASDALKYRFGIAYDRSPIGDALRTARLPDNDRKWLSVGATYTLSPQSSFDFAYAHVFIGNTSIASTSNEGSVALRTLLLGTYDESADVLMLQYNLRF